MDNTTHTPGSLTWLPSSTEGPPLVIGPVARRVIAELNDAPNMDQDACLFAASFELLKHLKVAQICLMKMRMVFAEDSDVLNTLNALIDQNESVIAKAEGRSNGTD